MKLPFSYRPCTLALGSVLVLAACGGSDNPAGAGSSTGAVSGSTPAASGSSASSINAANAQVVAAQAVFASNGLTSAAGDDTTVVANAPNNTSSKGLVDTSLKQVDKALSIGFLNRAAGLNNVLTVNCEQGGTATLTVDAANGSHVSTGDHISLVASNCADGTDVANGEITVDFNNVTGTPSASSAWSTSATITFNNVSFDQANVSRFANGTVALVYDQTAFRTATFSLASDSVQLRNTTPSGTTDRTLTGLNTSGSVNGNVFTYRTGFTLSGNFSQLGQSPYVVNTTTDFVQQRGSDPSQGVLQVTASDGSALTLTAVAPSSVNIALDSNGDGAADTSRTTTWNDLAALL